MSAKPASYASCALMLLWLSGCGVDGEPQAPPPKTKTTTSVGIGVGSNGVNGSVATTMSSGNVSLTVGTGTRQGCRSRNWGRCW